MSVSKAEGNAAGTPLALSKATLIPVMRMVKSLTTEKKFRDLKVVTELQPIISVGLHAFLQTKQVRISSDSVIQKYTAEKEVRDRCLYFVC